MMDSVPILIGAGIAALMIFAIRGLPRRKIADAAYICFAIMLAIYVGAHLAASGVDRLLTEIGGATIALGLAYIARERSPILLGPIILCHAAYDQLFGMEAGVPGWYPPLCLGFDGLFGAGIILLLARKR